MRVVFGVPGGRILISTVDQETPRVANSHEKIAQRGPTEISKEDKSQNNKNYDTLISNDPERV